MFFHHSFFLFGIFLHIMVMLREEKKKKRWIYFILNVWLSIFSAFSKTIQITSFTPFRPRCMEIWAFLDSLCEFNDDDCILCMYVWDVLARAAKLFEKAAWIYDLVKYTQTHTYNFALRKWADLHFAPTLNLFNLNDKELLVRIRTESLYIFVVGKRKTNDRREIR